ncbi:MAG TPA: tripartite tricarboxylate transporter substrate binding protein [Xanthobacteraceae bacterium]
MQRLMLVCALLSLGAAGASADNYPSRSIRVIVPFAAGGAVDSVARVLTNPLAARLGQPFVIYNHGGAGGGLGMEEAAKSAPDGYTLLLAHSGLTYMPGLYDNLRFDPVKDFDGIVTAVSGLYVLAVNPTLPAKSVAELIAYAKANPGKLTYGSAGSGTSIHLAGEFFKREAGVDIIHVPYKGAAPAVTDLAGGQIQMMFGPAVNILPLAQAGKIRALAVTSSKRSALAPDLPAVAETLPGFEVVGWYGFAAPAGTPKDAIAKLNAETNRTLQSTDLVAQFRRLGYEPLGDTPEQATARIKSDVAHWTKIIRDAGIQPQ